MGSEQVVLYCVKSNTFTSWQLDETFEIIFLLLKAD